MEPWLKIEIAGPPQGKGRPRSRIQSAKSGRQFVQIYTPAETRHYEERIAVEGRIAMLAKRLRMLDRALPVKVEILSIFAIPQSWSKRQALAAAAGEIRPTTKPDWDNIAKAVSDALNGIVWADDVQIVDCRVQKFYGERSFLHVEVFI